MNHSIGFLFKAIPLIMALICICFGLYVLYNGNDQSRIVPGVVLISLSAICIALFTTAAVIIAQLEKKFKSYMKYIFPTLGYGMALTFLIIGFILIKITHSNAFYVAGHITCGISFITACVATVATSSIKFSLIPVNSEKGRSDHSIPENSFSASTGNILKAIPIIFSIISWLWTIYLLNESYYQKNYIAGFVMVGLSCICTSLIALVWSIIKQINNSYSSIDRKRWPYLVFIMGGICIVTGLYVLVTNKSAYSTAPGIVLLGLGLICYSISSKVLLLSLVWKGNYPLANRIPLIPTITALACLIFAAFLFEAASTNNEYFIPARVMIGLGAICFCLYSIVSILESGTQKKK